MEDSKMKAKLDDSRCPKERWFKFWSGFLRRVESSSTREGGSQAYIGVYGCGKERLRSTTVDSRVVRSLLTAFKVLDYFLWFFYFSIGIFQLNPCVSILSLERSVCIWFASYWIGNLVVTLGTKCLLNWPIECQMPFNWPIESRLP